MTENMKDCLWFIGGLVFMVVFDMLASHVYGCSTDLVLRVLGVVP